MQGSVLNSEGRVELFGNTKVGASGIMAALVLELRAECQAWHQPCKTRRRGRHSSGFHLCYRSVFCSIHGTTEVTQVRALSSVRTIICVLAKSLHMLSEGAPFLQSLSLSWVASAFFMTHLITQYLHMISSKKHSLLCMS